MLLSNHGQELAVGFAKDYVSAELMKVEKSMVRITCYDGVRCIGGNKILLEDDDTKLWLDFGLNFGRMSMYYEEYLKPKNCLGLYEPVQMGLLPPIEDLYRQDLVCCLADPWVGQNTTKIGEVQGIILSHAHLDHIGAMHYLREDIPVYSSAMTAVIAKVTQDTGTSGTDNYCYIIPQEAVESGEIAAAKSRKVPSRSRQLILTDESVSAEFRKFWTTTPSSREHQSAEPKTASNCGRLKIRRFSVDHSVLGASAWVIETSAGVVVYTGDVRCHGMYGDLTLKFAEEVSKFKPRVLIIEGTRVGSDRSTTEHDVRARALEEVKKATGLVVADFGARNVERLCSFLDIAKETNRKLVLLPKDAYLLRNMASAAGDVWDIPSLNDPHIVIYDKFQGHTGGRWQQTIKEEFADKYVNPLDIAKNQADYVCCFSFFDVNELAVLRPWPGSIWLYSSCEPFNEEMAIDFQRLENWLNRWGIPLLGGKGEEKSPFHVSGHASRQDLLKIIEMIQPQAVIPVHVEEQYLAEYKNLLGGRFQVILPEQGIPVSL